MAVTSLQGLRPLPLALDFRLPFLLLLSFVLAEFLLFMGSEIGADEGVFVMLTLTSSEYLPQTCISPNAT